MKSKNTHRISEDEGPKEEDRARGRGEGLLVAFDMDRR